MTKAKRMMQEDIKLIDIVIELLDARAPLSSKNPDIDNLAANKSRMVILNKADMADARKTAKWEEYFKAKGFFVLSMDSRKNSGMKPVSDTIREACKEKIARDRKRGIGKDVELLDTPGILWPKFDDQEIGLRLAYIGSINDEILTKSELALKFIDFLKINYCNALTDRYNIDIDIQNSENFEILKQIAVARLCLLKGNEPDLDKAAAILFDDFRSGRLGRMTLEEIPE